MPSAADTKLIMQFQRDYDLASTAESRNRELMVDDLRFAALDQWPDEVKAERKNRPMLTLDKIGQPVRKILGGIRENMPSIKVDPVDDGADKETADVLEDLTRQIEQASNARNAYLTAAQTQVKCGYGVWRVVTQPANDDMFDQDIRIARVRNPFTVYFDPDADAPQKQDGRFVIISETISNKEYESRHGKRPPASIPNQGTGETQARWYDSDSVRVGEYFCKKKKKRKLVQLSTGAVLYADDITEEDIQGFVQGGVSIAKERTVEVDEIHYYKLSAFEVLEHQVWPGMLFPVIPVYGEEENIEGETIIRGIVRPAKDAQRMYNYFNSSAAEQIALQPKAPFVATANQIKNHRQFWDVANTDNLPYLLYEPDPDAPGPPQRQQPPMMQSGLLQQAQIYAQDIQEATGVFEVSTGQLPAHRSGRAVIALQQEADRSSNIFIDNLAGAIEHTGRIIIELIPIYYDTQRAVRLRGEDDATRFVEINKPMLSADGMKIQHDLTRGKYDVRVGVGPGYRTRRIEAASSMVELARVFPQVLQVAGDLVAKNLDWPGADEMAERLRKLLPPGLVEDENQDPEVAAAQQAQAQAQNALMQQMGQLELQKQQAEVDQIKSKTLETLTVAQQNEIENQVHQAEVAAKAGNQAMMEQALQQISALISSAPAPQQPQPGRNADLIYDPQTSTLMPQRASRP